MSKPFRLGLTIRLLTPLSSGAAGSGAVLADKVVVRNGMGEYILPGSQVRGTLRHACERLLRAMGIQDRLCDGPHPEQMCPQVEKKPDIPKISDLFDPERQVQCCAVCAVFGSPYFPSPIQFHDLVCTNPFRKEKDQPYSTPHEARLGNETLRPMISINRRRGVVEKQRLFFVETTPAHPRLTFTNSEAVAGMLESEAQVKLLFAGLRTIVALGGGRSRGLGWTEIETTAWLDNQKVMSDSWEDLQTLWHSSG